MSELKTLRDVKVKKKFENSGDFSYLNGFDEAVNNYKIQLKQEAINWIKHWAPKRNKFITGKEKEKANYINALVVFFNITEEDLTFKKLKGGKDGTDNDKQN